MADPIKTHWKKHTVPGESNSEYHSKNAYFSSSDLIPLAKSPAHYIHYKNSRKEESDAPESDALKLGSAMHSLFLEPHLVSEQYTFLNDNERPFPELDYRNTANKNWKVDKLLDASNKGQKVLNDKEWDMINGMVNSFTNNYPISRLMADTTRELSHYLEIAPFDEMPDFKIKVKIRPDLFGNSKSYIGDAKSCRDANLHPFTREMVDEDRLYDARLVFTLDCMNVYYEGVRKFDTIYLFPVEKTAPYFCNAIKMDQEFIELGRFKYKSYLRRLADAQRTGLYKGYDLYAEEGHHGICIASAPGYALTNANNIIV